MIGEYICARIRHYLKKNNMSSYRLSVISGIPSTTLSEILKANSTTIPTIITLERICDAFNISLSVFFAAYKKGNAASAETLEFHERIDRLDPKRRELLYQYVDFLYTLNN